ncbi:S41 family peptidase [Pontibacter toksunensis]|uniref:S41 family peptidase n=1 Tax=Pontibacter toksunensis TaxID=1332631 RepID=A0ABW6C2S8_9BACT
MPAFSTLQRSGFSGGGHLFNASVTASLQALGSAEARFGNRYVHYQQGGAATGFNGEKPYREHIFPEDRLRLLALFRYWNVIHFFYPHHSLLDRPWEEELLTFIPLFVAASDAAAYHATVARLVARINDSHGAATSPLLNYGQKRSIPFEVAIVEGKAVVAKAINSSLARESLLQAGDVILERNGMPITVLLDSLRSFHGASNEEALLEKLAPLLLYVDGPQVNLLVQRSREQLVLREKTYLGKEIYSQQLTPGLPSWEKLKNNIGYIDLRRLKITEIAPAMETLMACPVIIFDLRGYPEFLLYDLAAYLLPTARHFAKLVFADLDYPGSFRVGLLPPAGPARPKQEYYKGKVVVLIDQKTLSRAEFTAMALQAVPGATLIGSPTAGADGTNTHIALPGGIITSFSCQGILYPDGKPTQGKGIQPHISVKPTIAGIKNGKDEVLNNSSCGI